MNIDRRININRNITISRTSIQTTRWQPDVRHRKGVPFRSETTRERYGQSLKGAETRRDFRGFGQGTGLPQASGVARQSPPVTKSQQASKVARQAPRETKGPQVSGATRQTLPETKSKQVQGTPPKVFGGRIATGTLDPQRLDRSSNRTAFGSTERGIDVQKESHRGHQSLQDMSSKGAGGIGRGR